MTSFRKYWEIIKSDTMTALHCFRQHVYVVRSCNASFFALIPKKEGSNLTQGLQGYQFNRQRLQDSSKGVDRKIKEGLNKLVFRKQNAFIKSRQIIDTSFISNEVLDCIIKSIETGILCKLDIKKAFEQLNWIVLINMLKKMEFQGTIVKMDPGLKTFPCD